jgi:hypothetical protein
MEVTLADESIPSICRLEDKWDLSAEEHANQVAFLQCDISDSNIPLLGPEKLSAQTGNLHVQGEPRCFFVRAHNSL